MRCLVGTQCDGRSGVKSRHCSCGMPFQGPAMLITLTASSTTALLQEVAGEDPQEEKRSAEWQR